MDDSLDNSLDDSLNGDREGGEDMGNDYKDLSYYSYNENYYHLPDDTTTTTTTTPAAAATRATTTTTISSTPTPTNEAAVSTTTDLETATFQQKITIITTTETTSTAKTKTESGGSYWSTFSNSFKNTLQDSSHKLRKTFKNSKESKAATLTAPAAATTAATATTAVVASVADIKRDETSMTAASLSTTDRIMTTDTATFGVATATLKPTGKPGGYWSTFSNSIKNTIQDSSDKFRDHLGKNPAVADPKSVKDGSGSDETESQMRSMITTEASSTTFGTTAMFNATRAKNNKNNNNNDSDNSLTSRHTDRGNNEDDNEGSMEDQLISLLDKIAHKYEKEDGAKKKKRKDKN